MFFGCPARGEKNDITKIILAYKNYYTEKYNKIKYNFLDILTKIYSVLE
jgi:hypothetical protein